MAALVRVLCADTFAVSVRFVAGSVTICARLQCERPCFGLRDAAY